MSNRALPIGIDDFEKIRIQQYYYVDKTWLIKELLDKKGEVNLFTRPRRFGKTLNLSMLKYFFEKPLNEKSNKALFEHLKIMKAGEKYTNEQEQYPVIFLSLKSAKQKNYDNAYGCLCETIADEYLRHKFVVEKLPTDSMQEKFNRIMNQEASEADYLTSLAFLSKCLYEYYQKKVIILIDEYDVPLENAYYAGFYKQMITFIRSLFESALKTNPYLAFSVITGCLRISKESIFTGLNNLEIISILNRDYDEYFGFVEEEVQEMLIFYHRENKMDIMKRWYDGYLFGNTEVYNPWSVINYVKSLCSDENAFPTAAWSNTSSNSIVKELIEQASDEVKAEIECLTKHETIEKKVHEDITYEDIHESEDNLWNFLLFTGYLKVRSMRMEGVNRYVTMAIPNDEVLYIYENTISNWFRNSIKVKDLSALYIAMLDGKTEVFQNELKNQLWDSISYMDNQEAFYHGFLLGVLANLKGYLVKSNREAGHGRLDLLIYSNDLSKTPVIIELKVADKYKNLENKADEALQQIEEKQYDAILPEMGYTQVRHYGISFFQKQIYVKMKVKELEEL